MERTGALIERLLQQYNEKAGPDKMLATVQLIAAELQQANSAMVTGVKKISVIMPSIVKHEGQEFAVKIDKPQPAVAEAVTPPKPAPVIAVEEQPAPAAPKEMPKPKQPWQYDPVNDIPTLTHQQTEKAELNEIMGARQESLNERLRAGHVELGTVLQSSPVRDLKKAIGINDRYVFLSELFKGDEAMYERSIKTINSFSILAEAEYWIRRELKLKLAWNEDSETVKHFDQLVRRRFS